MYYSLDRIAAETAFLMDDKMVCHHVPKECLPAGATEGTIYVKKDGRFLADMEETMRRRKVNIARLKKLQGKDR